MNENISSSHEDGLVGNFISKIRNKLRPLDMSKIEFIFKDLKSEYLPLKICNWVCFDALQCFELAS